MTQQISKCDRCGRPKYGDHGTTCYYCEPPDSTKPAHTGEPDWYVALPPQSKQKILALLAERQELLAHLRDVCTLCESGWITPERKSVEYETGFEAACDEFAKSKTVELAQL